MRYLILFTLFISLQGVSQQKKQYELYFDSGKALLSESAYHTLDSLFKNTDTSKIRSVNIFGYCDSVGNSDYNKSLSIRRAESVKSYFTFKGVNSDSILIKGFGKTNQKYKTEKWDLNRRVSVEIIFKKTPKTILKKKDSSAKTNVPVLAKGPTEIDQFVDKGVVGDKIALKNINFYGGSSKPLPESNNALEKLLKTLQDRPALEIQIEGHICCTRTDEDDLSGRRAKAIYDYLVEKGIDKNRLSYKGFGHTQPLTEERNSYEQQMNRRVEIRITKK